MNASYRVLVQEGNITRPLAGMRISLSIAELESILGGLRAMCPEDTFTYEVN